MAQIGTRYQGKCTVRVSAASASETKCLKKDRDSWLCCGDCPRSDRGDCSRKRGPGRAGTKSYSAPAGRAAVASASAQRHEVGEVSSSERLVTKVPIATIRPPSSMRSRKVSRMGMGQLKNCEYWLTEPRPTPCIARNGVEYCIHPTNNCRVQDSDLVPGEMRASPMRENQPS